MTPQETFHNKLKTLYDQAEHLEHTLAEVRVLANQLSTLYEKVRDDDQPATLWDERVFLETLIETAQVAVLVLDTSGHIVQFNPYLEEASGYTLEEVRGRDWFSTFLPAQEQASVRALFLNAINDIQTRGNISAIVMKDGTERIFEWYDKTLKDHTGQTVGLLAIGIDVTERLQAEEALRQSEERHRIISESISDYVYAGYRNASNRTVTEWVSGAFERITGYTLDEVNNMGWHAVIVPEDLVSIKETVQSLPVNQSCVFEYRITTREGDIRWLRDYVRPIVSEQNGDVRIVGAVQDVTERKETAREVERLMHRNELILNAVGEGVLGVDTRGTITFANPAALRMLGYDEEELIGLPCHATTHPALEDRSLLPQEECPLCSTFWKGIVHRAEDVLFLHKSGRTFPVAYVSTPIIEQEIITGAVITFQDITERKAAEKQLRHQVMHDSLTNLPNRALFMELLGHAMRYAKRHSTSPFAVLFLDLDNFKVINDSLGHLEGDQLLITTAGRLKACLRASDVIARFGGDEFAILLEEMKDINDVIVLVQRIKQELTLPFVLNGHEIITSASIGIVLYSDEYRHPADMLRDADTAMYRAKSLGPGNYIVFDAAMHAYVLQRLDTQATLRRAIEHNELRLHYQPIVELETSTLVGFEALVRWQHPQRGLLYPDDFIPTAEETGLVVPLGWWVLHTACTRAHDWHTRFPNYRPLFMNVNISGQSFKNLDVVDQIRRVLQTTGCDPASLKLEITESTMMDHDEKTIYTLNHLRGLGVQLTVDDFGMGYSSLRYLHRFPVQSLKIDRSFVWTLSDDTESAAIVQSIVTLSKALGKEVVAEGIETVEQLRHLRNLKCEYGQGFFFSRPMDEVAAEKLLASSQMPWGAGDVEWAVGKDNRQ